MLTRKDLFTVDPKRADFIEHFQALLPGLRTRQLSRVYALHYHVTKTGVKCLDLDMAAKDIESMDTAVKARIAEMFSENPDQILPAASDKEWMALTQASRKYTRRIFIPQLRTSIVGIGEDL